MRLSKSHWAGGRQVTRARLLARYRVRSLFNHARYDPFGNIRKQQFGGYSNGTFLPTYDQTSNRYQLMADGFTPTYDTNGNLLTYTTGHSYSWDAEGRLYQLDAGTAMVYDALGRRMEQPNWSVILYGPVGSKLAVMGSQAVQAAFIPLPGGATAVYTASGLSRYRHPDWLGTARFASKPDRTIYFDGPYSPYGESYVDMGTPDHNFTGQNQDLTPNGDLYDFLYREHHAPHGRWISPDPAGINAVNPASPQSWNRYAYVAGNPINSVDPLGLCDGNAGVWTFGGNCGFQQAMSWLIGAHGWDPAGGVSIAPSGGLGGFGTTAFGDPGDAEERRHASIITTGWDPELQMFRTGTQYVPIGADLSSVLVQQKVLAAIQIGIRACSGQAPSAIAGCMTQIYNSIPDPGPTALVGGNWNFSYASVTYQGQAFDLGEFLQVNGCLAGRCGIIDPLHFHGDGTFHVDTANPFFVPIGSLIHLVIDVIGGHSWWSGGIPRP